MDMLDVQITNPDYPGNTPTSTISDFSVPPLERVDLTAPSAQLHNGFVPLPICAVHIDPQSYDASAPLDDVSMQGMEPWVAAQADIDTHVEDPNVPPLLIGNSLVPNFYGEGETDLGNNQTNIVGETSERPGQLYNALGYGPDGDDDDDDTEMPPYGQAFTAPGLTHRERHLDPLFEGLKEQVPVYDGALKLPTSPVLKATYDGAL